MTDVRLLRPIDYDEYFAVHLAGLQEFPAAFTTDATAWRDAPREVIARHLEASENDPERPILGVWDEDRLIGLIGVRREERRSVAHKAGLWGFYVLPEHRRCGLGRALVAAAIRTAATSGIRQLRAVVATNCTAALGLFEDVGFERFGLERDGRFVEGRWYDLAYLWYKLPHAGTEP